MEVSINDLSFKGQFESFEQVESCINNLAIIATASMQLTGYSPIRRTKKLASRAIIGDKTIEEFKIELSQSKNPRHSSLLTQLLITIVQGPFIDSLELKEELKQTKSICGEEIEGTSLHAYLSKDDNSVNAVISADKSGYDDLPILYLNKSAKILNLHNEACCKTYARVYEANPKHTILKDKMVDGKIHSKMDLDDDIAQQCLVNGIQVLGHKYVYAFANNRWYEFPQHTLGCYHGYPIGNPGNNVLINKIKKVFGDPPYSNTGYKFCWK
ncbi:hypothetical protein AAEH92_09060 [Shewanella xiamenensis]|uniref:hypothetical protein n=1 Tax=Shewanella xiamenensis TaxID=332186 RepID=UPI00313CCA1F